MNNKKTVQQHTWVLGVAILVSVIIFFSVKGIGYLIDKESDIVSPPIETTSNTRIEEVTDAVSEIKTEEMSEEIASEETTEEYFDAGWKETMAQYVRELSSAEQYEYALVDLEMDGVPELLVGPFETSDISEEDEGIIQSYDETQILRYQDSEIQLFARVVGFDKLGYNIEDKILHTFSYKDDDTFSENVYSYNADSVIHIYGAVCYEASTENPWYMVGDSVYDLNSYYENLESYIGIDEMMYITTESRIVGVENIVQEIKDYTAEIPSNMNEGNDDSSSQRLGSMLSLPNESGYCVYTNTLYDYAVVIPDTFSIVDGEENAQEAYAVFGDANGARIYINMFSDDASKPQSYTEFYSDASMFYAFDDYYVASWVNGENIIYECYHVDSKYKYGFQLVYPIVYRDEYEQPTGYSFIDVMQQYIADNQGTLYVVE